MMWSCEETRRAIAAGDAATSEAAEEHIAHCEKCADLLDREAGVWFGGLPDDEPSGPAELSPEFERVQALVTQDRRFLGWLRSRPTPARVALGLLVPVALVGLHAVAKRRPDFSVYPAWRMALEVVLLAAFVVGASRIALRPLQRPHRPAWQWAAALGVLSLPVVMALTGPAHEAHAASLEGAGAAFWPRAAACFSFGVAMATPAWLAWAALDRQASRATFVVLVAAALSGLVGNFVLHLHCPITAPAHLLTGHAAVGFVLLPVALLVGWRRGLRRLGAR